MQIEFDPNRLKTESLEDLLANAKASAEVRASFSQLIARRKSGGDLNASFGGDDDSFIRLCQSTAAKMQSPNTLV